MRICMVTDNYYPYVGGVAEHVHNLAVELRGRGHTVKVLTSRFEGKSMSALGAVPEEHHIHRIGHGVIIPANRSFARLPVAWRPLARVRRYFREQRFDVVHIHGSLAPTLPLVAIRASRSVNVATFHAGHDASLGYSFARSALLPYFNALHGLIAVSETAHRSHAKYFPGPYRIIPNAVDLGMFRPDVEPMPELADRRPRVLFMGRIEPRKGLKYLLMAMPFVAKEVPDVELLVVGAGPLGYAYKTYLAPEVEKHVRWVGLVPRQDRPRYFAASTVFCSPAVGSESFGIVLLEAMASARPVVASDITGYRSVVTHGREGLLVQPRDVRGLARALVTLLRNEELARQMGARGRVRAQGFSWAEIAGRVEAVYRELREQYRNPCLGRSGN